MQCCFIIDRDAAKDGRAVAFFESFRQAQEARDKLEPTPTRTDDNPHWRFMVESYAPMAASEPRHAALTMRRLAEIGGRLEAYTLN